MRRITLIDSRTAGISGDMLLGALIDAGADLGSIQETLDLIPKHYSRCKSIRLATKEELRHGFRGCFAELSISEETGESSAEELIRVAKEVADGSRLSERAKSFATASIELLSEVESKLHGVPISQTHMHEAGSTDTLADVFGVAAACDQLMVFEGEVLATPVAVGGGSVSFSHGTLPTPAPAVLELTRKSRIPIVGGPEAEELATPTGVSMLACLTDEYLEAYPAMTPERVGYGAGKRKLAATPNLLRVILGYSTELGTNSEKVQVVETNIDDVPGEILGHALECVLAAGAKDAWITPAIFKKSRPGHVLHAICNAPEAQKIAEVMIKETGTLGVRYQEWNRFVLRREFRKVKVRIAGKDFQVRIKVSRNSSGEVLGIKPEFDDMRLIAQTLSMPVREVSALVIREVGQSENGWEIEA